VQRGGDLAGEAAARAGARADAEALHLRLLERQQRREALKDRLMEDARRAKREQLLRIEVRPSTWPLFPVGTFWSGSIRTHARTRSRKPGARSFTHTHA
jgi:hypothetical protein